MKYMIEKITDKAFYSYFKPHYTKHLSRNYTMKKSYKRKCFKGASIDIFH